MRKPFSLIRLSHLRLSVLVALALVPGCRSATQTDLVEREMRQQEDQIYALQDYLADYERKTASLGEEGT